MRILFVSSHAELGGAELYLQHIVTAAPDDVRSITAFLAEGPAVERFRSEGHAVTAVDAYGKAGTPKAIKAVLHLTRSHCADVIHANGVKAAVVATVASLFHRVPFVWAKVDHTGDGLVANVVAFRAAAVVGVSRTVTSTIHRRLSRRVRTVYNGVKDQQRTDSARKILRTALPPSTETVLVMAARLTRVKGHADALEALALVAATAPNVGLVVVGGPSPEEPDLLRELQEQARELGIQDRVAWLGHREDASALVAAADIALVPSRKLPGISWAEGFGLTAAEAMAAAVPVVAYHHGALPEVVATGGYTVPEGDVSRLAERVLQLTQDEGLRKSVGEAAAQIARERYDLKKSMNCWYEIYGEVARRRKEAHD